MEAVFVFVYSFRASSFRLVCTLCACLIVAAAVIAFMPDTGSALNVNKILETKELSKIDVKNESGRMAYLTALGFEVKEEPVSKAQETVPKVFDAVTERYNGLQRLQGFDLAKYAGKKVTGYTYRITALPDGTKIGENPYYATLVVYKNKVVAADICCPSRGEYTPLVKAA